MALPEFSETEDVKNARVKSATGDNRVAYWDGDILIAGSREMDVAITPEVKALIDQGKLEVLTSPAEPIFIDLHEEQE